MFEYCCICGRNSDIYLTYLYPVGLLCSECYNIYRGEYVKRN
jgi:recombinational DNA repair protein (RecF pathway)